MRRALLAGVLLLCACGTTQWVREDRNAEETDKDIVDCTRYAQREGGLRADGFYGGPGYGPAYGGYAQRNRMLDEARMTDSCMYAKGYRRQQAP